MDRRKALKDAYKSRPVIGGVCCIRCSGNGRCYVQASPNLEGLRNRFNFAVATGGCPDPSLRAEWTQYGIGSFTFSVLDELTKSESQSDREFAEDINALYEIWLQKAQDGTLQ